MGGNKVRQIEFPLGEAQSRDADTLLITSAVQSNYVRVAAAAGRRLGMETHIQLEERVPDVDTLYRTSGNVLLDRLFGAKLHTFPVGEDEPAADASLDLLAQSLEEEGRRPYVIHLAPAHPPIGALGYVIAVEEIQAQARSLDLKFDAVVCPTGSALTHAGILVGLRALGANVPVYGICVRRDVSLQRPRVAKHARHEFPQHFRVVHLPRRRHIEQKFVRHAAPKEVGKFRRKLVLPQFRVVSRRLNVKEKPRRDQHAAQSKKDRRFEVMPLLARCTKETDVSVYGFGVNRPPERPR